MTFEEYLTIVGDYARAHENDWMGVHDCHYAGGVAENIERTGLCLSFNPFGKKVAGRTLEQNFRRTLYHLNNPSDKIYVLPVCPVFVRIPSEILKLAKADKDDLFTHYKLAVPGVMERPYLDEQGNVHRSITPASSKDGANINLLPTCFIEGHIDMATEEFVSNPLFYENLSDKEKDEVKARILQSPSQFQPN